MLVPGRFVTQPAGGRRPCARPGGSKRDGKKSATLAIRPWKKLAKAEREEARGRGRGAYRVRGAGGSGSSGALRAAGSVAPSSVAPASARAVDCGRRPSTAAPETERGEDREEVGAVGGARGPPSGPAGSPTIATRIAVPSTAPTWRKAALTALAVAKRSSGTSRTAAEPRVGKARPMPMPVRAGAGQPDAEPVGLGPGRAQDHHPGGEEEGAGDDHGAVAEAVGELVRPGRRRRSRAPAPAASRRRPGARCSPRSR